MVNTAAFHARVRGSVPGLGGLKETKLFLPHPRVRVSIVGSLRDREVACSASDRQGSNFESCVWRTVSSQSSHHPQEVLLAQFSLYVHKGGLKPDSFHFFIESVFLRSPDKGFWACLGDLLPDMPRRPETWVSLYNLMMKHRGIWRSSAILGSDSPQSNNGKDHSLWVTPLIPRERPNVKHAIAGYLWLSWPTSPPALMRVLH